MPPSTRIYETRGTPPSAKKRRAGKLLYRRGPKKAQSAQSHLNLSNISELCSSLPVLEEPVRGRPLPEEESGEESDSASSASSSIFPSFDQKEQRQTAAFVDAYIDAKEEKEAAARLTDANRKLKWNPDIKPTDEDWKAISDYFRGGLLEGSIESVLLKDFEDAQMLLLQPPMRDGPTKQIQDDHTRKYKEALGPDGNFHGVRDNLATKLTMVYFGLPVEPMSLKNIHNAGLELDSDDSEDEPEEPRKVTRFMYKRKPLKFLDEYHERSHGFPILRKPRPQETAMGPVVIPAVEVPPGEAHTRGDGKSQPSPIYPGVTEVGMRGGAGPVQHIYLYGPNTGRVTCSKDIDSPSSAEFIWCALQLLGLDPASEWEFEIDQYDNQDPYKDERYKRWVRSFTVGRYNYQTQWENFLRERLCDPNGDWAMVVDRPRSLGVTAPKRFEPPRENFIPPPSPVTTSQVPGFPRRLASAGTQPSFSPVGRRSTARPSLGQPPRSAGLDTSRYSLAKSLGLDPTVLPRFNKERLLAARAAPLKTQKFDPWMAEQNRLDHLKRESWHRDQAVVEPGQKPEPPLFGASRELAIAIGDSMPTVYAQRLTPTDITQLLDENQSLRNMLLERMDNCPMCDATFPNYDKAQVIAHLKEHSNQMASAGVCPECESEQWTFMTTEQRKYHLMDHRDHTDSEMIKAFWDEFDCPVCDLPLGAQAGTRNPQDILYHMAEHPPGIIRHCDKCGVDIKDGTAPEQGHHMAKCIRGTLKNLGDPDSIFCDICGQDRTNETAEGLAEHRRHCHQGKGKYCSQCGFNLSMNPAFGHRPHQTWCKPPRGFPKKFCRRCGINLAEIDDATKGFHRATCHYNPPKSGSAFLTPSEDPAALNPLDGHIKNQIKFLMERTQELNKQGADLKAREAALENLENQRQTSGLTQRTQPQMLEEEIADLDYDPPKAKLWDTFVNDRSGGPVDEPSSTQPFGFFGKPLASKEAEISSRGSTLWWREPSSADNEPTSSGLLDRHMASKKAELAPPTATLFGSKSSSAGEESSVRKRKRTAKARESDSLYRYEDDEDEDEEEDNDEDEIDLETVEPESLNNLLLSERKRRRMVMAEKDLPYRDEEEDDSDSEDIEGRGKAVRQRSATGTPRPTTSKATSPAKAAKKKVERKTKKKAPAIKPAPGGEGRKLRDRSSATLAPASPKKAAAGGTRKAKSGK